MPRKRAPAARRRRLAPHAQAEGDLALLPAARSNGDLEGGAGVEAGADPAGQAVRAGLPGGQEPLRPMNSLRSPVSVRPGLSSTSKKPMRSPNSCCSGCGQYSAPLRGSTSVWMCMAVGAQLAQHPLT
jgi:hypothetical protein